MLSRLDDVRIFPEDFVDVKDALSSENPMKMLVGFTCLQKFFKTKIDWLSSGENEKKMLVADELKLQFKEVLDGTIQLMVDAL